MPARPWLPFARRCTRIALLLGGLAALGLAGVWIAPSAVDPWAVPALWLVGWYSGCFALLASWAYAVHPDGRRSLTAAAVCVLGVAPAVPMAVWAEGRRGLGAVSFVGALFLVGAALVVAFTVLAVVLRAGLGLLNRWRRLRGKPSLDAVLTKWAGSKRRPQLVAIPLIVGSGVWLLFTTFMPTPAVDDGGIASVVLNGFWRLVEVSGDLATGLIAGALVLWFQEDRFWSGKPRHLPHLPHPPRRTGRRRMTSRRWASR